MIPPSKRARRSLAPLALLLASLGVTAPALAGKLDDAERETQRGDHSTDSSPSRSSSNSSGGGRDGSPEENALTAKLALLFFRYVLLSPFTIPYEILESEKSYFETFARPPMLLDCGMLCVDKTGSNRRLQLTGGAEIGIDLEGVPFTSASLRFESPFRLGLATKMTGFREVTATAIDYSLLGHSNLTVMFARSTHSQFRAGAGARYFAGPSGSVALGFDFVYGFELQSTANFSFEAEAHLGNVGDAFAPAVRGALGYWVSPVEFYLGWDQNWLGSVPLGGPIFGVRATY